MPEPRPKRLLDRHVLLVGAIDAAGRAAAVALARAGATVSVTTLRSNSDEDFQANSILNELWSLGRAGIAVKVDAASPEDLRAALARVEEDVASADVVILMPEASAPPPELATHQVVALVESEGGYDARLIAIEGVGQIGAADAVVELMAGLRR